MESEMVLFESSDGEVNLNVEFDGETVWLTKEQMGVLFGRDRTVITRHISNVYKESELDKKATCAKIAQVQTEGGRLVKRNVATLFLYFLKYERCSVGKWCETHFRQRAGCHNHYDCRIEA